MKVIGRAGDRYLIDLEPGARGPVQMHMGTIVHGRDVDVPARIGSILVQGEPDEWDEVEMDPPEQVAATLARHATKISAVLTASK